MSVSEGRGKLFVLGGRIAGRRLRRTRMEFDIEFVLLVRLANANYLYTSVQLCLNCKLLSYLRYLEESTI